MRCNGVITVDDVRLALGLSGWEWISIRAEAKKWARARKMAHSSGAALRSNSAHGTNGIRGTESESSALSHHSGEVTPPVRSVGSVHPTVCYIPKGQMKELKLPARRTEKPRPKYEPSEFIRPVSLVRLMARR